MKKARIEENSRVPCPHYLTMEGIGISYCDVEECPYGNYQTNKEGLKRCKIKGLFDIKDHPEELTNRVITGVIS